MNRVATAVPPDDEALDALLGAFFKAEMPAAWPAFQPPRSRVLPFRAAAPARQARGFFIGSRVALAASVALLLLAAWLMPREPLAVTGQRPLLHSNPTAGPFGKDQFKTPDGRDLFPGPLPDLKDLFPPAGGGKNATEPNKVKSSLQLEQKDGKGSIRIDVEELPPNQ